MLMLLEPNKMLGKKLLITGKGRCNVTNDCDVAGPSLPNIPGEPALSLQRAQRAFRPAGRDGVV